MANPLTRYMEWLHTRWPAGTVEKLPEVREEGATTVPGVRIVGDLTGIPLLKFSSDTGARAAGAIAAELRAENGPSDPDRLDVAIVGGGVSGIAAALEAKRLGLRFRVFEAAEPFATVANFPKGKPIYTYPTGMTPAGQLQFASEVHPKEELLASLEAQRRSAGIEPVSSRIERVERERGGTLVLHHGDRREPTRARRVIVAIGRSGNHRRLNVPGEDSGKVFNRLYDPKDFAGKRVLVVGGGDSALETAIALASSGAHVTLSYRKREFARPKPENVEKLRRLEHDPAAPVSIERPTSERVTSATGPFLSAPAHPRGSVRIALETTVARIEPDRVVVRDASGREVAIDNDVVFTMIGREAPLDFFRRSGIRVRGEWKWATYAAFASFLLFCVVMYHWKSRHPELPIQSRAEAQRAFPYDVPAAIDAIGGRVSEWSKREPNVLFTIARGLGNPAFYYTLAYCTCVVVFGVRRIRRRKTPYVTLQTLSLIAIQCLPLFILPEIILPWMGRNGLFSHGGASQWLADHLFERYDAIGHDRAYWRSYGFILAFPLNVYNVFTDHPLWLWLGISFVQTFVVIPLLIRRWGKGAYCGWICSCGALAETMGDAHRQKMPHGPLWNRINMVGQVVLGFAFLLFGLRVAGWVAGNGSWPAHLFRRLFEGIPFLNYSWSVDIFLAGILGVGMYFWFSGRVWCRFACPLAALMHIYARFSKFRIFPEKAKCISCNVCTSVCHQGIDVMSFANKGVPMEDPQCVRCSACVQMCPTGVLSFGRVGAGGLPVLDRLAASPVLMAESGANVRLGGK
jgi:thioredoxin reductase/NAD-dependent dihydropyrimidine dehydrogenase PreA subunit